MQLLTLLVLTAVGALTTSLITTASSLLPLSIVLMASVFLGRERHLSSSCLRIYTLTNIPLLLLILILYILTLTAQPSQRPPNQKQNN